MRERGIDLTGAGVRLEQQVSYMSRNNPSPRIVAEINQSLKRAYCEASKQDLPPRFETLLQQLRAQHAPTHTSKVDADEQ